VNHVIIDTCFSYGVHIALYFSIHVPKLRVNKYLASGTKLMVWYDLIENSSKKPKVSSCGIFC
jgi:hypothetical protein